MKGSFSLSAHATYHHAEGPRSERNFYQGRENQEEHVGPDRGRAMKTNAVNPSER